MIGFFSAIIVGICCVFLFVKILSLTKKIQFFRDFEQAFPLRYIVVDHDGKILYCNGFSGKNPASVADLSLSDPGALTASINRTFNKGKRSDLVCMDRNGLRMTVTFSLMPQLLFKEKTVMCIFRNSGTKEAAGANSLLQMLIDKLPFAVCLKDPSHDFQFMMLNHHFAALVERKPDEIIGKNDLELDFTNFDPSRCRAQDKYCISSGAAVDAVEKFPSANGLSRVCHVMKMPIRLPEDRTVLLCLYLDITESNDMKLRQDELIGHLNEMVHSFELTNGCLQNIAVESSFEKAVNSMLTGLAGCINAERIILFKLKEKTALSVFTVPAQNDVEQIVELNAWPEFYSSLKANEPVLLKKNEIPESMQGLFEVFSAESANILYAVPVIEDARLENMLIISFPGVIPTCGLQLVANAVNIYRLLLERDRRMMFSNEKGRILSQIFDHIENPIIILDRNMHVTAANDSMVKLQKHPLVGSLCSEKCPYMETFICNTEECPFLSVWATSKKFTGVINMFGSNYAAHAYPILNHERQVSYVMLHLSRLCKAADDREFLLRSDKSI